MYQKEILPNGVRIITESISPFRSATIGIWINTGCMDEPESKRGISHFIEHLLFKGTKTKTAVEISEIMDGIGGNINAFTEKEQTCYYAKVMDKHIPIALDILGDMVRNSVFGPDDIEREKGVVIEEIKMYEDAPDELIYDFFTRAAWDTHPLGLPTLGTRETIMSLTRDDILDYMEKFYTPDRILVVAAGHIKHHKIVEFAKKTFGDLPYKPSASTNYPLPVLSPRQFIKFKECEQVYLCMGTQGIPQRDDRKYPLTVLDSIVGGSMSSRLFQEIREKRGLVYNVSTFQSTYSDSALFGIYAGMSAKHLKTVIDVTLQVLQDVRDKGVTKKEMHTAKEHLKGALALALESSSNRMIRLAKSDLYHNRFITHQEVIKKIEKATLDELQEIAKETLDNTKYAAAVLGPVDENMTLW